MFHIRRQKNTYRYSVAGWSRVHILALLCSEVYGNISLCSYGSSSTRERGGLIGKFQYNNWYAWYVQRWSGRLRVPAWLHGLLTRQYTPTEYLSYHTWEALLKQFTLSVTVISTFIQFIQHHPNGVNNSNGLWKLWRVDGPFYKTFKITPILKNHVDFHFSAILKSF